MIRGMARAGAVFGREDWLASARRSVEFLRSTLWEAPGDAAGRGRLLATYKDGRAHLNAYLDDYAFLLDALVELMQADFRPDDLEFARALAEVLLERFRDDAGGGFFFTSHDHERLIHRPKPGHDNATPSGNGVAAFALNRLGHLVGEPRYIDAAAECVAAYHASMRDYPGGYSTLAMALEELLAPPAVVVLRGPLPRLRPWLGALQREFRPQTLLIGVDSVIHDLPEALDKPAAPGRVNAYVCRGVSCLEPVSTEEALRGLLAGAGLK
jgi:uncharacterized protein YyaL (SSP411 family)